MFVQHFMEIHQVDEVIRIPTILWGTWMSNQVLKTLTLINVQGSMNVCTDIFNSCWDISGDELTNKSQQVGDSARLLCLPVILSIFVCVELAQTCGQTVCVCVCGCGRCEVNRCQEAAAARQFETRPAASACVHDRLVFISCCSVLWPMILL